MTMPYYKNSEYQLFCCLWTTELYYLEKTQTVIITYVYIQTSNTLASLSTSESIFTTVPLIL